MKGLMVSVLLIGLIAMTWVDGAAVPVKDTTEFDEKLKEMIKKDPWTWGQVMRAGLRAAPHFVRGINAAVNGKKKDLDLNDAEFDEKFAELVKKDPALFTTLAALAAPHVINGMVHAGKWAYNHYGDEQFDEKFAEMIKKDPWTWGKIGRAALRAAPHIIRGINAAVNGKKKDLKLMKDLDLNDAKFDVKFDEMIKKDPAVVTGAVLAGIAAKAAAKALVGSAVHHYARKWWGGKKDFKQMNDLDLKNTKFDKKLEEMIKKDPAIVSGTLLAGLGAAALKAGVGAAAGRAVHHLMNKFHWGKKKDYKQTKDFKRAINKIQ